MERFYFTQIKVQFYTFVHRRVAVTYCALRHKHEIAACGIVVIDSGRAAGRDVKAFVGRKHFAFIGEVVGNGAKTIRCTVVIS